MTDQLPTHPLAEFVNPVTNYRRRALTNASSYLSMNGKTGKWTVGQEETDVNKAQAIINSRHMEHGYIRWGELKPAKAFASINKPYPPKPDSIEGFDHDGNPKIFNADDARQITGQFTEADLGGFVFNTSSMGGVENVDKLFDAIILKGGDGTDFCFPMVELDNEWYKRKTGKVYKPVFKILHWCDEDGTPESAKTARVAKESPPEPEQDDAEPRRRVRRT
jgi:hypothetical protein